MSAGNILEKLIQVEEPPTLVSYKRVQILKEQLSMKWPVWVSPGTFPHSLSVTPFIFCDGGLFTPVFPPAVESLQSKLRFPHPNISSWHSLLYNSAGYLQKSKIVD